MSALLFDLLSRTYHYPLEYIIEALAPTTELDFDRLPRRSSRFTGRSRPPISTARPTARGFSSSPAALPEQKQFQLMGITDTAMLRPQVFAFCDGEVQVGLICSEKQAIDATLLSLSKEDKRICPVADRYWNARGGSHNDGGAFIFNLQKNAAGKMRMTCTDKFGEPVPMPARDRVVRFFARPKPALRRRREVWQQCINEQFVAGNARRSFEMLREQVPAMDV